MNIRKQVSNQVSIEKWDNFFSYSMAVFVLLERISPGLTNQNTFNSVHTMNYEIIVLLCCWLEVIKWMQQSIPVKVLLIESCGGLFLGDRIWDLENLYLLRFTKRSNNSKNSNPLSKYGPCIWIFDAVTAFYCSRLT